MYESFEFVLQLAAMLMMIELKKCQNCLCAAVLYKQAYYAVQKMFCNWLWLYS